MVPLGGTGIEISAVGAGTWQWGDRFYWGFGRSFSEQDVREAYRACIESGVTFFDTAEVYALGGSERLLGRFTGEEGGPAVVATKFLPYPWRLSGRSLRSALRKSLRRLGMERVDLYQVHQPWRPRPVEAWASALADVAEEGLVRSVGVSNYSADQMRRANDVLSARGVPLASNQVGYSFLNRKVERNGVAEACRELGVTLIAYGPLAEGLLTGKYSTENPPPLLRRVRWARRRLPLLPPVIGLMREIGQAHGDKSPSQVALNWLMRKGAVPIAGSKSAAHARSNAGAMGWRLSDDDMAALDEVSAGF
ncbi:MAG: aldo/keto reductase [Dehalococcoidia bacterium]